jgi:hypothetical protein
MGDFLKKVILNNFLFESEAICITPGILLTYYMFVEPVNTGACLMNNQEYLCLVFTGIDYRKPEYGFSDWVNCYNNNLSVHYDCYLCLCQCKA